MKKKALTLSGLFICSIVISVFTYLFPEQPYRYPYQPGTKEWDDLKTLQARVEACQVPENLLPTMSTEAMATTALNYPLIHNLYYFNTYKAAYDHIAARANIFREFENRPDAGRILLQKYMDTPVTAVEQSFDLSDIEIILAQDIYISKLNPQEIEELNIVAQCKYQDKLLAYGENDLFTKLFYIAISESEFQSDFVFPEGFAL